MGAPGFFQRTERQECGPVPFLQAAVPGAAETEKKNTNAQGLYVPALRLFYSAPVSGPHPRDHFFLTASA